MDKNTSKSLNRVKFGQKIKYTANIIGQTLCTIATGGFINLQQKGGTK